MLGVSLLVIGSIGLLAMTWLFPVAAIALPTRRRAQTSDGGSPARVAILIPAHNEEGKLERTLGAVHGAIRAASAEFSHVEFSVCVGADGCTDGTAQVARASGANVVVFKENQGKWK